MAIIPLYRDILRVLQATPPNQPVWPRFSDEVYYPHRAYFEGLLQTYGEDLFGPGGLPAAVEQHAPALRAALAHAPAYGLEDVAARWMTYLESALPWQAPNVYLGTLFFTAPAATLSVLGRPAIAVGLERFHPSPPAGPKYWYHPGELAEMLPHEATHVARMQALDLPPTPRRLTLLEMITLEGTALTFTDSLLGRQTLATFMPADRLQWHRENDLYVRLAITPDLGRSGMEVFLTYFSDTAPISGYYAGYSLCSQYLRRHGPEAVRELVTLPSRDIVANLLP